MSRIIIITTPVIVPPKSGRLKSSTETIELELDPIQGEALAETLRRAADYVSE